MKGTSGVKAVMVVGMVPAIFIQFRKRIDQILEEVFGKNWEEAFKKELSDLCKSGDIDDPEELNNFVTKIVTEITDTLEKTTVKTIEKIKMEKNEIIAEVVKSVGLSETVESKGK